MLRRVVKKAAVVFLILVFALTPIRWSFFIFQIVKAIEVPEEEKWQDYDNYIVIDHDDTWSGDVVYDGKPVVLVDGATLTIKAGTHIAIKALYVYLGRIVAEGTVENKITFTRAALTPDDGDSECFSGINGMIEFSDWSWIYGMEPSIMRYVEFSDMGYYKYIDAEQCFSSGQTLNNKKQDNFFNTVYAEEPASPDVRNPALRFNSGQLHIENSSFINNAYTDVEAEVTVFEGQPFSSLEIVNSNFSGNKQGTALISSTEINMKNGTRIADSTLVRLKNNWYGDIGSPKIAPNYLIGGEMVKGDYTLDGFRSSSLIADPVVIIPGIMGSFEVNEKMVMDPILHTYDNLINSLNKNGYQKNANLFEFPYEWRNSNVLTANTLKQKIQDIKNSTSVSRVDLVAHSMGGLVARYYIEGDDYQNDVDQLITLGTPHKGSPEAYLYWEAGEGFFSRREQIAKKLFEVEAHHAGYDDLKEYIQNEIKSVGELLPDYDYLEKVSDGDMKKYPDGYPENSLLKILNDDEKRKKMGKVDFTNITGNLDSEKTLKKFRVAESNKEGKWEHGIPENFYDSTTDRGMKYGKGDETVPLTSAEGIVSDKKIEINSAHNDLPTNAQCHVIKELTGKADCESVNTFKKITSILTFGIFSPIDIQIIAPDGKKIGKNLETGEIINEVKNAYYSGAGAGNEFLAIPNPQDGEYKILAQGTGNGEYKIEATKISKETDSLGAFTLTQEIIGTAVKGNTEEKTLTIGGEEKLDENDTIFPVVSGAETTSAEDSDDEDDDSEKDTPIDKENSDSQLIFQSRDYDNFNENSLENNYGGKVFSDVSISPDFNDLSAPKGENKKFTGIIPFTLLVLAIFGIMFFGFQKRVDKKI